MIFRDVVALNISPGSRINAITFVVAVNPVCRRENLDEKNDDNTHSHNPKTFLSLLLNTIERSGIPCLNYTPGTA